MENRSDYFKKIKKKYLRIYKDIWNIAEQTNELVIRTTLKSHIYNIPGLSEVQKDRLWQEVTNCY